jgi:DNA-binding beta-propeller fold protein YncE
MTGCAGFWVYPGSSNGGSGSTTGDYVYVANATAETLTVYSVGTGTLTAVPNSTETLAFVPQAMAITPSNSFLYLSAGNGYIYCYTIGSGGVLTTATRGPAADVVSMDISPNGQWLLGLDANTTTPTIDVFPINTATGALGAGTQVYYSGTFSGTINPLDIKVSPNGNLVFAALGTAGDVVFTFNSAANSGLLQSSGMVVPTSTTSDNGLAVSSDSSYLYIARSGPVGDSGLAVYSISSISSGGTPTKLNGSPLQAGSGPYSVVLNTAGTDAYVANRIDGTISGFSIASSSGTLTVTALSGSYSSGSGVNGLAVDNSGKYLLAIAGGGSPDLAMYSYDSTTSGKLDLAAVLPTGSDPTGPVAIAVTH